MSSMRAILIKNVSGLGIKGDVVKVKRGFFMNFLFPSGKAVLATNDMVKDLEESKKEEEKKKQVLQDQAKEIAQKLKNVVLDITAKSSKAGKLYASITAENVCQKLKDSAGIDIPIDALDNFSGIKKVGDYKIEVNLSEETKGHFKVKVAEEK